MCEASFRIQVPGSGQAGVGVTYYRLDGEEVKRCAMHYLGPDDPCLACSGTLWIGGEPAFEVHAYHPMFEPEVTMYSWSAEPSNDKFDFRGGADFSVHEDCVKAAVATLG